jgi:thiamine pyrophosphokinase
LKDIEAKRAVIIANGDIKDDEFYVNLIRSTDIIICVDGGTHNALKLGLKPEVIIGDLDSLTDELRDSLANCEFIIHPDPVNKDETDLELSLRYAIAQGFSEILILGALGKRLDHTLANLLLLAETAKKGIKAKMLDERQEIFMITDSVEFEGEVGDIVSLLPLTEKVTGIYTKGLQYKLENGTLHFGLTLGVSNIMTSRQASIKIGDGILLAVRVFNCI